MSEITVDTVQGLGDLIWVLQKLTLHYERINLNVLHVSDHPVQFRAWRFMELLKPVGRITYKPVTQEQYDAVAQGRFVTPLGVREAVPYAVNRPLELGTRLEAIDEYPVDWGLRFDVPSFRKPVSPYMLVYISGSKNIRTWSPSQWIRFVAQAVSLYNTPPRIVMLGAEYDRVPLKLVGTALEGMQLDVDYAIGLDPAGAVALIRDASLLLGYQSGLNVVADMYDVPQVMLYFPALAPMRYTWCKPSHQAWDIFKAFTFDQTPGQILPHIGATCEKWRTR